MIPKPLRRTLKLYQAHIAGVSTSFWQNLLLQTDAPVACRRGCADCCYQPLTMSLLDGVLVYQWLADNHLWTRAMSRRFKETADRTMNLAPEIWMMGMIPCPLLDEEKHECRAYKARPFVCRVAFSHDPYLCHPHRFVELLQTPQYAPRKEALVAIAKLETELLRKHHLPRVVLPFAAAVLHGEALCETDDEFIDRARVIWIKQLRGD